jgi:hypothetical protein
MFRHAGVLSEGAEVTWLAGLPAFGAHPELHATCSIIFRIISTVGYVIQPLDMQSTIYRNDSEEPDDSESGFGKSKVDNGKDGEKRGVINRVNSECSGWDDVHNG